MLEETIIAISTPLGYGGLGIVRLSGGRALPIANKLFKPKKKKAKIESHRPILGNLYDFEKKDSFEEAYLIYFPQPNTYTREDVVEISSHGSPLILEEIVRLGIKAGARHAHPGEFTLRAYLRGRIDILQAEAVNDIIQAFSLKQAKISFKQMEGSLSRKIASLRARIIHLLSQIEASIEFPEEGLHISSKHISKTLETAVQQIEKLIQSYDLGKTLSEGLTLAIAGRTNVGKSTLFNAFLERERAIVTPYPGTTRDFLQENIRIKDSVFTLIDMAGMATASHPVEKEGIKRGKRLISQADGVLLLFDSSKKETEEDLRLLKKYKDKKMLLLFNKMDLPLRINKEKIKKQGKKFPSLDVSALKGTNMEKLKARIHKAFVQDQDHGEEIVLHLRQKLILEEIRDCLSKGLSLLKEGHSEDFFVEEIRKSLPLIGQLTGEIRTDHVIEEIFNRFCIGK
jgi:tRNA modification GTPase